MPLWLFKGCMSLWGGITMNLSLWRQQVTGRMSWPLLCVSVPEKLVHNHPWVDSGGTTWRTIYERGYLWDILPSGSSFSITKDQRISQMKEMHRAKYVGRGVPSSPAFHPSEPSLWSVTWKLSELCLLGFLNKGSVILVWYLHHWLLIQSTEGWVPLSLQSFSCHRDLGMGLKVLII